jgi:cation diffusion facilitator family transporter
MSQGGAVAGGSTKVVVAALVGNALIAVTKFAAAAATGSSAMFAEAVHSVVDTGNQGLLLFGLGRAARPADARHPFGYGKEIYFWAFVVAILLFGLGSGIAFYEGVQKLRAPHPIDNAGWNYVVLALAMVFEAAAWLIAWREFNRVRGDVPVLLAVRQSKDPALFTVLFVDSAAMLGLVVAFVGIFAADRLGWMWADGVATLVIGGILALAALLLAIETKSLLIGEAAASDLVEDIIGLAGQASFVDGVNEVRTMHFGPMDVLVNISVDARDQMPAGLVERGISALEDEIKQRFPEVSRVFIEIQSSEDSAAEIGEGDAGAEPA